MALRLCVLVAVGLVLQSVAGFDCGTLIDLSEDTCTSDDAYAALTIHSDKGIEGHKYVTIAPDSEVVACEDHKFITECRGRSDSPRCSNHQETYCAAGCMPFTSIALEIRTFKDCLVREAEASVASKDRAIQDSLEYWLENDGLVAAVERMSTHAYKYRSLIESGRFDSKDYIVKYLAGGVSGGFQGLATRMGDSYHSRDFKTYEELTAQVADLKESFDSYEQIRSGRGVNIHRVSYTLVRFYKSLVDRLDTCFTPTIWDNMYCAPALWPYVGFYAGLRYHTDGWTSKTADGRDGTQYYAQPSCARVAITKLLAWQAATWAQPGLATSFNKKFSDTVNPSPGTSFSCQAFTNGFKTVMQNPRGYGLPSKCVVRVVEQGRRNHEELLQQLEADLAVLA